jgi:hypothetical protein
MRPALRIPPQPNLQPIKITSIETEKQSFCSARQRAGYPAVWVSRALDETLRPKAASAGRLDIAKAVFQIGLSHLTAVTNRAG